MNELIKHTTRESYYPRSRGGHFPTASTYEAGEKWPEPGLTGGTDSRKITGID